MRRDGKHTGEKKRRNSGDDPLITLFVANLPSWPENSVRGWLQDLFQRWGTVTYVFIPRKKDASGRSFAFVRMARGSQAEKATVSLNGRG